MSEGPDRVEAVLRDGTAVLIRPVVPADRALILDGFGRLSEASRVRRFLAPVGELSDAALRRLTEVDGHDHVAWIAVLAARPDFGIGTGRAVRLAAEPTVAEAAITVVDAYQGRGLGTLLLGMLASSATREGVEAFRAYVLEDNAPMRAMLEGMGARPRRDSPGVLVFDVPLDPASLPDSAAGRVLREVAAGRLPVGPPERS